MIGKLILIAFLAIAQGKAESVDSVEAHNLVKDARCREEEVHYLLPHEWNCSQFYYCEYGYKRTDVRVCPEATYFSYELQVCVHPLIANCNLPNVPPEDTITTEQPTTQAPTTTTTEAPIVEGWLPNGCPVDYRVEQLFPHETESNLYYQCTHGELVLKKCAAGTHFNFEEQICSLYDENESENGESESGNGSSESEDSGNESGDSHSESGDSDNQSGDGDNESGSENDASTTTQAPPPKPTTEAPIVEGWLPNGCPVDYRVEQLFPHETESNLYYQCAHGELVLMECVAGTHFNFEEQMCSLYGENESGHSSNESENKGNDSEDSSNEIEDSGNESGDSHSESGDSDNESGNENDASTTTQAPPAKPTTEAPIVEGWLPNGCPVDYRVEQLFPHETESNLYYQCAHGELVLMECVAGTHFNFEEQMCSLYGENESGHGSNESEDKGNDSEDSSNESEDSGNESGDSDNQSGDSDNESGSENDASTTTQAPPPKPSTEAPIVEGWLPNGCPVDYRVEQLFPHETESNLYYQCAHGELVLRECVAGTHFNFEEQMCSLYDENESGNNENGSGNGENESGNGSNESEDSGNESGDGHSESGDSENESGDSDNESGNENDASTTTQAPPPKPTTEAPIVEGWLPNGCPVDYRVEQLFPHETESNLYYQCAHGELVLRECVAGTHFNFEEQMCSLYNENESGHGSNESEDKGNDSEDSSNESEDSGNESGDSHSESGDSDNQSGDSDNESGNENDASTTSQASPPKPTTEAPIVEGWLPNGCPIDYRVEQLFPHETESNLYYQCAHGELVLRECVAGTHFNFEEQMCSLYDENESGNNENGSGNGENESGNGSNESGDSHSESGDSENESGNGSNESGHSHSESGDSENESGDSNNESGNENDASTTTQAPPPKPTTEAPIVEGWLPNGCPVDYRVEQLFPHETESNLYYQCAHGELVLRECVAGTHFNFEEQMCSLYGENESGNGSNESEDSGNQSGDSDSESGDSDNESGDSDNESGNENDASTITQAPPTKPTTEAPIVEGWLPNGCPVDYRVEQLFPHETESNLYYQCTNGELVLRECAAGTHFNFEEQMCSLYGENESGNSSNESEDSGNDSGDSNNESGDSDNESGDSDNGVNGSEGVNDNECPSDYTQELLLPHSDCSKFYQCSNGVKVEMTCPYGLHFSVETKTCEWSLIAGCGSGNGDNGDNGNGENGNGNICATSCNVAPWAHETDCDKYWWCDGQTSTLAACSEGLHFNANTKTCDFIFNAECIKNLP